MVGCVWALRDSRRNSVDEKDEMRRREKLKWGMPSPRHITTAAGPKMKSMQKLPSFVSGERYARGFKSYFRATSNLSAFLQFVRSAYPPSILDIAIVAILLHWCLVKNPATSQNGFIRRHRQDSQEDFDGMCCWSLYSELKRSIGYAANSRWWNQKTTTIVFFILAILSVLARTTIQLRYKKKFSIDDAFLYFAVICLCAAVGLLWTFTEAMYFNQALFFNSPAPDLPPNYQTLLDFSEHQFHKTSAAYLNLAHTSIFAVKFSFLFFFRVLIRRVQRMITYWWTIFGIIIVAWAVTLVADILPCPYFDIRASKVWLFNYFCLCGAQSWCISQ